MSQHRTAAAPRTLADIRILRVLSALNRDFAASWSIRRMAKTAGMSRAAFVRKFRSEVGMAPLAYLTRLRMHVAAALLVDSDVPAADVARDVGYASPFAFSRAFKRVMGVPPSTYRWAERIRAASNGASLIRAAA
jgi:transcriptional regulator GlxA family with amidase domain